MGSVNSTKLNDDFSNENRPGVAPGIFRQGADSSDEGAKVRPIRVLSMPKLSDKIVFHLPTGG